jgi:flagella basal body P-ring formation protein FlgA
MRLRTLIVTLAFATLAVAGPAAAGEVVLKPAVIVTGDIVHLGDLFADLPADKVQLPAAYSPRPGERVVLDAERLMEIARVQGVAWQPKSRFDRVVVERASRLIDRNQITEMVATGLRSSGVGKDDKIVLDNDNLRLYVPIQATRQLQLRDLRYDPQTRRFSALLLADPSATDSVQPIAGRVIRMVELPVPARALNRDDVIGARDLQWVKLPADRLDQSVVSEQAQLVGQAASHFLRAGEPIRSADIHPPVLVTRGSLVTMVYQTPAMTITVRGKAIQDGAKGETIRVMNIQSKRELDAVVADAGTVVIGPARTAQLN